LAELQQQLHQTTLMLADAEDDKTRAHKALRHSEERGNESACRAAEAERRAGDLHGELEQERATCGALQQALELAEWHANHRSGAMHQLMRLGSVLDRSGGSGRDGGSGSAARCARQAPRDSAPDSLDAGSLYEEDSCC
jgi:hypothetical protein